MNVRKINFYKRCLFSYINYKRGKPNPVLLILSPTMECNLKCSYCATWQNDNKSFESWWPEIRRRKASIENMKSLISEAYKLGIAYITVSGGEPLLIDNIESIGQYAQNKGLMINLGTNGTLLKGNRAKQIINSFDQIRISLDGMERTHDKLCGVPRTFSRVVSNVKYVMEQKKKAKIGLNFVINDENEKEIPEFTEYFKDMVDFISIIPRFDASQCGIENMEKPNTMRNNECDAGRLYIYFAAGCILPCPYVTEHLNKRLVDDNGLVYEPGNLAKIYDSFRDIESVNCHGCLATCTTNISRIFKSSPLTLIKNSLRYRKHYAL